jgi:hypothetical protein
MNLKNARTFGFSIILSTVMALSATTVWADCDKDSMAYDPADCPEESNESETESQSNSSDDKTTSKEAEGEKYDGKILT